MKGYAELTFVVTANAEDATAGGEEERMKPTEAHLRYAQGSGTKMWSGRTSDVISRKVTKGKGFIYRIGDKRSSRIHNHCF